MIVDLPPGNFNSHPPYTPIDVPTEILSVLEKLHSSPALWWMGQFLKYMMRPKKSLEEKISNFTAKIEHPIVG